MRGDNLTISIMNMISHAGEAKYIFYEAIKEFEKGNYDSYSELMEKAEENLRKSHEIQFQEIMVKESGGESVEFSVLLIHAMDILANTANLIEFFKNTKKLPEDNDKTAKFIKLFKAFPYEEKPWGGEYLISNNESFICRVLHIKKGEAVSLQYHKEKLETLLVLEGSGIYYRQKPQSEMEKIFIEKGDVLINNPYELHRERAIEDLIIFEVSTTQMEDIIRVEDDYGRAD